MTDHEFLGYVRTRSRSGESLFHRDHVTRLFEMAGLLPPDELCDFVSVSAAVADPLVDAALRNRRGRFE